MSFTLLDELKKYNKEDLEIYIACGIDMLAVKLIKQDTHSFGCKQTTYLKTCKK